MNDLIIICGMALTGSLLIDVRKHTSTAFQLRAGLFLLTFGWIILLITSGIGPLPDATGRAVGCGLMATGGALLITPVLQARRARRGQGNQR